MIEITVLGDEVGVGIRDNGNAGITAIDRKANVLVTIEFTPDAWRNFVKNAPRVRGVGIPIAGRAQILVPKSANGETD